MKKTATIFTDVWIIEPDIFKDERGFFLESYSEKKLANLGIKSNFVQDNHSKSVKGTIRGLHFQLPPGQRKLVRCSSGEVWDVVADIRPESPTFRKWFGVILSEENFKQIYIPVGFAHGFAVLSDIAEVQYKVSNYYDPNLERGIKWDDAKIKVDWKTNSPILSQRDLNNPSLNEFYST
ncbi:dTDP-4-dehydrorhamnose 3,5-epimerase [Candidatus Lokiarchaeum ossiferum]|uniref:dTDP-4-dehydrorhamnose 3,5-epimerase n=1 Tax=Candidatus Lokiarchaeum ossiferum TaxID=2951803 RepID=UPI00352D324D